MSFLQNLTWRYATKKFDNNQKISPENLAKILEAIRFSPSSYGIQPYKILVIENKEIQAKLQEFSYNQPQISSASHLLVFVARADLYAVSDEFFTELSGNNPEMREKLAGYENSVKGGIEQKYSQNSLAYASEQAHIALGFAMSALAELQIDSCAIGGFDAEKYAEILGLSDDEVPCVLLPIGYRDASEMPRPKWRKSEEKIFAFVK